MRQPAARSTDPAVGGQQAASSGRHQATGHMFATSQDRGPPVAVQNLFVLVAAPNIWTNSKVKIFSFWEEYSPLERITLDLPFQRK